jgi:hypothetical protein
MRQLRTGLFADESLADEAMTLALILGLMLALTKFWSLLRQKTPIPSPR